MSVLMRTYGAGVARKRMWRTLYTSRFWRRLFWNTNNAPAYIIACIHIYAWRWRRVRKVDDGGGRTRLS